MLSIPRKSNFNSSVSCLGTQITPRAGNRYLHQITEIDVVTGAEFPRNKSTVFQVTRIEMVIAFDRSIIDEITAADELKGMTEPSVN